MWTIFATNQAVSKYNSKVVYSLLSQVLFYLNRTKAPMETMVVEDNNFFFG
jgi:uncharacterized protein YejL (UPF0352 family)